MAKRSSVALQKARAQLASARKRATGLRKRYNQPPLMRIASIAGGGVASAVVSTYLPITDIGGIPVTSLTGVALVAGGTLMKGSASEVMINVGSGMLACGLQDFTRNQLQNMGA